MVSSAASVPNSATMVMGRAPTERRMAISRRRSLSVVRIVVTMPSSAVATTMAETTGQRRLGRADEAPQFLQRRAGNDRGQRLLAILVDGALQLERGELRVEANQRRRNRLRLEMHLAHLVGRDGLARNRHAVLPIDVDGLDGLEAHVQRPVDGRAGFLENARDAERLVLMLDERDAADAVGDDDPVADLVSERTLPHRRR